jgi:hypothetical protein
VAPRPLSKTAVTGQLLTVKFQKSSEPAKVTEPDTQYFSAVELIYSPE